MPLDRKVAFGLASGILPLYDPNFISSPGSLVIPGFDVLDVFWGLDHDITGLLTTRVPFAALAVNRDSGEPDFFNRGTETVLEWLADADARHTQAPYLPLGYLAHNGFTDLEESFTDDQGRSPAEVFAKRGLKPRVIGHSLGCSVGQAWAVKANLVGIQHVMFESPRLWTSASVMYVLGLGFTFTGTDIPGDIVPTLPPVNLGYSSPLQDVDMLPTDGLRDTRQARHTLRSVLHALDATFPAAPEDAA